MSDRGQLTAPPVPPAAYAYLVLVEEAAREAEARLTELTMPPWVLPVVADVAAIRNDLRKLLTKTEELMRHAE